MVETADAIIIGAGIHGASLAFHLAQAGLRPAVLERSTAAGGATGRSSGLVRMHYDVEADARLAWVSHGYFANWGENIDLVGNDPDVTKIDYNWNNAIAVTSPAPPSGYNVSYVIHRLCKQTGDPTSITCVKQTVGAGSTASGTKGAASFGTFAIQVPTNALYRITVRVVGPRNSVSYVQAVVY